MEVPPPTPDKKVVEGGPLAPFRGVITCSYPFLRPFIGVITPFKPGWGPPCGCLEFLLKEFLPTETKSLPKTNSKST